MGGEKGTILNVGASEQSMLVQVRIEQYPRNTTSQRDTKTRLGLPSTCHVDPTSSRRLAVTAKAKQTPCSAIVIF
jgi:hypothetical protein